VWRVSPVVIWFVINESFFSFLSSPWKLHVDHLCCLYFNFNPYSFDFFFILSFLYKFYLFSILSFNFNLPNIIFSNLVLILLIFNFFPWLFYKSSISFQLYRSIQIDGIMFFDLVIIILISNFFSWFFRKSYYSF
jgi:hypothetical protein